MRNIRVIGSGQLRLLTGACLAELGNRVIGTDDDVNKIASLAKALSRFMSRHWRKVGDEYRITHHTSQIMGIIISTTFC